jgi:cytochrome c553
LIDMKRPLIIILLYSLLSCLGYAEPSTNVAWTPDLKRLVLSGDADQGAEIETVETEDVNACTDCHGVAGAEPDREKHPMLASQMATYTYKQLLDYKDGKRKNRRMQEAVERLSEDELAALAAWYQDQAVPSPEVDAEETVSEETVRLVFKGDKQRLIQPCAACHGARGQGALMDVPALAGQNVTYFVNTMKDYAKEKRKNDVYARMRLIAQQLTRQEINELAVYYARLGSKTRLAEAP